MASFIAIGAGGAGLLAFLDTKFTPKSESSYGGLNPLFFVTPLVLSGVSIFTMTQGLVVGKARAKYIKQAKQDGEKDVDERYDLPNLYAQGTSKNARAFNAVQRSHQHIFENFPNICMTGMVSAISYPIAAAISTTMYAIGRVIISKNYEKSEGDAKKRYSNKLGMMMWFGFLFNMWLAPLSCIKILSQARLEK